MDWYQDLLDGYHARWLADHVLGYNLWASIHGKPELQVGIIYERSYEGEWE